MGKITLCGGVRLIPDDETDRCADCKDYYPASDFEAITRQLAEWETEVGLEMPTDFKDWWQNSKNEHPLVARLVLENRRKELADAREEITRLRKIFKAVVDFDPPEICKDEFAYDRLKEAYRTAAKAALEASDA